jgi:predicted GIY-YIG superfamily endonuclease
LSKGFTYILECADGSFYTGSTKNLEKGLWEHSNGIGANLRKPDYLLNWFIMKNTPGLMQHFIVRNRFRVGAEKRN